MDLEEVIQLFLKLKLFKRLPSFKLGQMNLKVSIEGLNGPLKT